MEEKRRPFSQMRVELSLQSQTWNRTKTQGKDLIQIDLADISLATIPDSNFDPRRRHFTVNELKPQPIIRKRKKVMSYFCRTIVEFKFLYRFLHLNKNVFPVTINSAISVLSLMPITSSIAFSSWTINFDLNFSARQATPSQWQFARKKQLRFLTASGKLRVFLLLTATWKTFQLKCKK